MADRAMGMTIGNPVCEWVRARLPLWVDVAADPTERPDPRSGEGGELSTADRRSIDRHLGACPACRQHRTALEQALGALAVTAAALPVRPDAPSLWSLLERRIAVHEARTRSRWLRAVHGVVGRGLRASTLGGGERPLRWAWMRDSLSEMLAGGGEFVRGPRRRPGAVVGAGMVAAVLAVGITIPATRRQQADARAIIRANAAPLDGRVVLPVPPQPAALDTADSTTDRDLPAHELAQAEPVPAAETPVSGLDAGSASQTAAAPHYDYDLEHGVPMPPDARDSTLIY